jgi:hypothetical protein
MKYCAIWGSWNGACYETYDHTDLAATDEDAAIEELAAILDKIDWDDDADVEVTIVDEDGEEVYTEYVEYSVAQERQKELLKSTQKWDCEHEYSTYHLVHAKDGWYAWTTNGGSLGAYDRMRGDGRWVERYEMPRRVDPDEAKRWLIKHVGMDTDEAAAAVRDED